MIFFHLEVWLSLVSSHCSPEVKTRKQSSIKWKCKICLFAAFMKWVCVLSWKIGTSDANLLSLTQHKWKNIRLVNLTNIFYYTICKFMVWILVFTEFASESMQFKIFIWAVIIDVKHTHVFLRHINRYVIVVNISFIFNFFNRMRMWSTLTSKNPETITFRL